MYKSSIKCILICQSLRPMHFDWELVTLQLQSKNINYTFLINISLIILLLYSIIHNIMEIFVMFKRKYFSVKSSSIYKFKIAVFFDISEGETALDQRQRRLTALFTVWIYNILRTVHGNSSSIPLNSWQNLCVRCALVCRRRPFTGKRGHRNRAPLSN